MSTNSNQNNPLSSVFFVNLPENFSFSSDSFAIDPTIPLPIQRKDGEDENSKPNLQELSQEQILAGILTVLAYDRKNTNLNYYRSLITKARPNIKVELSETAILKTRNEEWPLAEEMFLALEGIDPEDMAITLNRALFYDQRADFCRKTSLIDEADAYDSLAESLYKKTMDVQSPVADSFFNAGFFYLKQRNFKEALSCFETYLALTVDEPDDKLGENGIYKKERAQEIINSIKSSNLNNEEFKAAYDFISSDSEERIKTGLDKIRNFLQNNPDVWNAWFMTGWGMRKLSHYEQAMQAFKKALELGGDSNSDTYNELAICQMELGLLDEAKASLLSALSLSPEDTKIISNLGYFYLKTGDTQEARKYFLTVLELDPSDKLAQNELAKLEL